MVWDVMNTMMCISKHLAASSLAYHIPRINHSLANPVTKSSTTEYQRMIQGSSMAYEQQAY